MTKNAKPKWPFPEGPTDAWKLGSGFTVETALSALYDPITEEEIPAKFTRLLDALK